MAAYKDRIVKASLKKKGFTQDSNAHNAFYFEYAGLKTSIRTFTSLNKQDVGDSLTGAMAKQTRLSIPDFRRLIECPMDINEYLRKLAEQGLLE